jgi:hypothetical protein
MTTHYPVVVALHSESAVLPHPVAVPRHLVSVVAPQPVVVIVLRVAVVVPDRAVATPPEAAVKAPKGSKVLEVPAPKSAAGAAAAHLVVREPAPPRQHRTPAHHRRCRRVRRESLLDLGQLADKCRR